MTTNKINITNVDFSTSGSIDNGGITNVLTLANAPANWTRGGYLVYGPNAVLYLGYTNTGYTTIYRCTDMVNFATWNPITLPVQANWKYGNYGNGKFVLVGDTMSGGYTGSFIYSSDDGATWGTGTSQSTTISGIISSQPVYGNKWIVGVTFSNSSNSGLYQSTDGINWTSLYTGSSLVPSGDHSLAYNSVIDRWIITNGYGIPYISTTNVGNAWTDISTNMGRNTSSMYVEKIISSGNYFIAPLRCDYSTYWRKIIVSTNGITWSTIYTATVGIPENGIGHNLTVVKDLGNGNIILWSGNYVSMLVGTTFTYNVLSTQSYVSTGTNLGCNNTQLYDTNPNYLLSVQAGYYTPIYRKPINVGKLSADRYVNITASKAGATSVTKRLYIKSAKQQQSTYVLYCNPGSFNLMSTLDGVVDPAAFTNATTTLIVTKDGIDQTGWLFSITNDDGLGASITGNILSITSLTNSVDLAYANISASKTGEPSLLLRVAVTKNKTGVVSGINRGSSLSSIITNSNTILSIKFLNTGMVQIKYGNGSYSNLIPWINPVDTVSPPGGSWWMHMITTGDAFTTSAGSGWLQLNTSREFIFDKTGSPSGTYTCNMTVQFGTTSTGGNISAATGSLQVIIP